MNVGGICQEVLKLHYSHKLRVPCVPLINITTLHCSINITSLTASIAFSEIELLMGNPCLKSNRNVIFTSEFF